MFTHDHKPPCPTREEYLDCMDGCLPCEDRASLLAAYHKAWDAYREHTETKGME